jgi:broad specificity phosphatase PhoE
MTKSTRIFFVRHGESEANKSGLIGGHTDPNLTDVGIKQVKKARDELNSVHFDNVYSSDLKRAIHTAEIIYGKPVPEENRQADLRERHFGSLEGKPQEHIHASDAHRQSLPIEESWHFKHVPDMESDHEVMSRIIPTLEKIAKSNPGKTILIVGHGGAIRTSVMKLGNYTYEHLPTGSIQNAGYAELEFNPDSGFKVIQISGVKL